MQVSSSSRPLSLYSIWKVGLAQPGIEIYQVEEKGFAEPLGARSEVPKCKSQRHRDVHCGKLVALPHSPPPRTAGRS